MFKGIVINKDESGYHATLQDIDESSLPDGDVTVRVGYSTLNYKDALLGGPLCQDRKEGSLS